MKLTKRRISLLLHLWPYESLMHWLEHETDYTYDDLDTIYANRRITYSVTEYDDIFRCNRLLDYVYVAKPLVRGSIRFVVDSYMDNWREHNRILTEEEAMIARELTINGKAHLIDVTLEVIRREKERLDAI